MGSDERIVYVDEYKLRSSAAEYREAIQALAARTRAEGHPVGLTDIHHANPAAGFVRRAA